MASKSRKNVKSRETSWPRASRLGLFQLRSLGPYQENERNMMRYTGATIFVATCLMAGTALAQTTTPPDAPATTTPPDAQTATTPAAADQAAPAAAPAAPAPPSAYHQAGMDFSFLLDGYVDGNANDPASGWNGLRNFDYRADTVHFNMGKITIDRAPGPIGFHLDVGFGEIFSATHVTDAAPEAMKYFEQAYVDFKPKSWKGVEVDVGEFVTSAGAEVIDVNGNWNYSRSLLFAWDRGLRPDYRFSHHLHDRLDAGADRAAGGRAGAADQPAADRGDGPRRVRY